jgi:hypothetical protein
VHGRAVCASTTTGRPGAGYRMSVKDDQAQSNWFPRLLMLVGRIATPGVSGGRLQLRSCGNCGNSVRAQGILDDRGPPAPPVPNRAVHMASRRSFLSDEVWDFPDFTPALAPRRTQPFSEDARYCSQHLTPSARMVAASATVPRMAGPYPARSMGWRFRSAAETQH